jgi:hypothetical protein
VDTGVPQPAQACGFANTFVPSKSKTFQAFPNVTFLAAYGDGFFAYGPAGFDTVSIGALAVAKQEIGVPNVVGWSGDGHISGILGLAFPAITAVYNTTDPNLANSSNQLVYNPFFIEAVQQKKISNPCKCPHPVLLCVPDNTMPQTSRLHSTARVSLRREPAPTSPTSDTWPSAALRPYP